MAGRPAKAAALSSGKVGKDKRAARAATEAALRGDSDKLQPPDWLNVRQREVFSFLLAEMDAGGVLGNVDVFVLTSFSVAWDRLESIEQMVNGDLDRLYDKELMAAKSKYAKDFETGLRELSLSPQARAKLGGMSLDKKQKEKDPVLTLLQGKGKISSA